MNKLPQKQILSIILILALLGICCTLSYYVNSSKDPTIQETPKSEIEAAATNSTENTIQSEAVPVSEPIVNKLTLNDLINSYGELDIPKVLVLTRSDIEKIPEFKLKEKYGKSSDDYSIKLTSGTLYTISFVVNKELPTLFDIYGYQKSTYCDQSHDGGGFMAELNIAFNNKITGGTTCYTAQGINYPFVHLYITD